MQLNAIGLALQPRGSICSPAWVGKGEREKVGSGTATRFWRIYVLVLGSRHLIHPRSFVATGADALEEVFQTISILEKSPIKSAIRTRYDEHFAV